MPAALIRGDDMRTFWSFHASAGDAADAPALPAELRIDGEIADDDDAW